jgi:hypothetical protein
MSIRKRFFKISILLFLIYLLIIVFFGKQVYRVEQDKYITVWKRFGGDCYIMPYRYYGLILPNDNYIKTDNASQFQFYFLENSPNVIVIRTSNKYIFKNKKGSLKVINFDERDAYKFFSLSSGNLKKGVNYIFINVKESYAFDSSGKSIEYSWF